MAFVFVVYNRLANKQDLDGAMDAADIIDALELDELANRFKSPCRVVSDYFHLNLPSARTNQLLYYAGIES